MIAPFSQIFWPVNCGLALRQGQVQARFQRMTGSSSCARARPQRGTFAGSMLHIETHLLQAGRDCHGRDMDAALLLTD